jgi:23S rRNA (uracil1939-C5)-methyltransferase
MARSKFKPFTLEGVSIIDISARGLGVGKKDGQVVFVEKAVPGDVVDARVFRVEKKVPMASIAHMVQPSPDRVDARCNHFGNCGGCKWQNFDYTAQLRFKEKHVRDAIERIGHLQVEDFREIKGCERPFNYRNKVEFTFSNKRWIPAADFDQSQDEPKGGALGYHVERFFDKIIDIDTCHLHLPIIDPIRNEIRRFTHEKGYTWHDIKLHQGYFRNLLFRNSEATGELMLIVVVNEEDPGPVEDLFAHLDAMFPQITSMVSIHSDRWNPSIAGLEGRAWKGPLHITEQLGQWKYRISPTSFFQTNTSQTRHLYDVVKEFVGDNCEVLYDLYCGAGSIGIYLSDLAKKVVGVEYVEAAVEDARVNCELNGLQHLEFFAGDMKQVLTPEFAAQNGKPNVVVTDPPRAGMDEAVVRRLLELEAGRIVYVSCNPSTQARDMALLSEKYDLVAVQPVDMFPHTTHVENVALLVRK